MRDINLKNVGQDLINLNNEFIECVNVRLTQDINKDILKSIVAQYFCVSDDELNFDEKIYFLYMFETMKAMLWQRFGIFDEELEDILKKI